MDTEQAGKLRAAFESSQIGHLPKAGITLDYVGHAATTDRLLQVDPEWTWRPFTIEERQQVCADPADLWIWLTICGVTRPGVGDGKNAKERIGDAIRNAAMRFGVALDLWAKEDLHSEDHGETAAKAGGAKAPAESASTGDASPAPSPFATPASASPAANPNTPASPKQIQDVKDLIPAAAKATGETEGQILIWIKKKAGVKKLDDLKAGVAVDLIPAIERWIENASAQEQLGGGVS
jgi:hypothetical protein